MKSHPFTTIVGKCRGFNVACLLPDMSLIIFCAGSGQL